MTAGRMRLLEPGDLPEILAIEKVSFPDDPWTLESFLSEMMRPFSSLLGLFEPPRAGAPARKDPVRAVPFRDLSRPSGPPPDGDASFRALPDPDGPLPRDFRPGEGRPGEPGPARPGASPGREGGRGLSAYAVFWLLQNETHLMNLAVAPDRRSRGLGREILKAVVTVSRATGMERVLLECREDNLPALRLYGSEGFKAVGRRRGYYRDGRTDAILMNLELGPGRGARGGGGA
jgi:ribosomal-protein-alanine acetyltransferase